MTGSTSAGGGALCPCGRPLAECSGTCSDCAAAEVDFPAAALVRDRMLMALEDPRLVFLVRFFKMEVAALSEREGAWYSDALVLDLCDCLLCLPAGLIASEFVPEPIRHKVGLAVRLASEIRGRIHWGLVDDFDVFTRDLTRLSEIVSDIFLEL